MRIPTLLQKIHDLVDQHDRPGILEVDLMLDYTRVLYADLLEWRARLSTQALAIQPPLPGRTPPASPMPTQSPTAGPNHQAAIAPSVSSPSPASPPKQPSLPIPPIDEPTLAELAAAMHAEDEEDEAPAIRPVPPRPVVPPQQQKDRPLVTVPKSPGAPIPMFEAEPPVPPKPQHSTIPPSTTPEPKPAPQPEPVPKPQPDPQPDPRPKPNPPVPELKPVVKTGKDIRSQISINDKYQIMSELFGNDKTAYEEALNQINEADSEEAALKWLQDRLWVTEERGEAAQNFYDMVKRFKSS